MSSRKSVQYPSYISLALKEISNNEQGNSNDEVLGVTSIVRPLILRHSEFPVRYSIFLLPGDVPSFFVDPNGGDTEDSFPITCVPSYEVFHK